MYVGATNGATGFIVLTGGARHAKGGWCRIHDAVTIELTDWRGRRVHVVGNPFHGVISDVLGPKGGGTDHTLSRFWENWCAKQPTRFKLNIRSSTKTGWLKWRWESPVCLDKSKPSRLVLPPK